MSRIVHWRIGMQNADGTHKATLDADDAVVSLNGFSLNPAGGCEEGSFTVIPSLVNVLPRDVVMVQVSYDAFATVRTLYKGSVVLSGDPRGDEPHEVRTVGLHQRLYEVPLTMPVIPGDLDVAEMAYNVANGILTAGDMPVGITHLEGFEVTGFRVGDRYPNYETFGAFLDAMSVLAGPFIVPPGETYSYGGRTWSAGETVPGATWGVNPSGGLYFYRPAAPLLTYHESDRRVRARWGSIAAEDVVNAPTLMYLNGISDLAVAHYRWYAPIRSLVQAANPVPVVRTLGSGASLPAAQRIGRVVEVDNPLDFMAEAALSVDFDGFWSNLGNAIDGDPSTYAEAATSIPTMAVGEFLAGAPAAPGATGAIEGILMVDYMPVSDGQFNRVSANDLTVYFTWRDASSQSLYESALRLSDALANQRSVMYLPVVRPADLIEAGDPAVDTLLVSVAATALLRLYEVKLYTPDSDHPGLFASRALAQSVESLPASAVMSVEYDGLGPVGDRMVFVPQQGAVMSGLNVERIDFSLTVEGGAVTVYEIGQPFDGDLLVEKAVLEKLSQSATGQTRWRPK